MHSEVAWEHLYVSVALMWIEASGVRISEGLCVGLLARCAEVKFLRFAEEVYVYGNMNAKACDLYDKIIEVQYPPQGFLPQGRRPGGAGRRPHHGPPGPLGLGRLFGRNLAQCLLRDVRPAAAAQAPPGYLYLLQDREDETVCPHLWLIDQGRQHLASSAQLHFLFRATRPAPVLGVLARGGAMSSMSSVPTVDRPTARPRSPNAWPPLWSSPEASLRARRRAHALGGCGAVGARAAASSADPR